MSKQIAAPAVPAPAPAPAPAAHGEDEKSRLGGGRHYGARPNVVSVLSAGYTPTILLLLEKAGLRAALEKLPVTVFVPSEAAFERFFLQFPKAQAFLNANPDVLAQVLRYHVLDKPVDSAAIAQLGFGDINAVPTLGSSEKLSVINTGKLFNAPNKNKHTPETQIRVNGAQVLMIDFKAANGSVVHVVDNVLLPYSLLSAVVGLHL